jgi:ABC-type histidine transport system ATPase subunit
MLKKLAMIGIATSIGFTAIDLAPMVAMAANVASTPLHVAKKSTAAKAKAKAKTVMDKKTTVDKKKKAP